MIRIFLAHASEDKEAVIELYDRLKEKGFQPWLDKKDLLPGQQWRAEIPKAIRNCDVFIACLSKKSVAKRGYIQREFRMALNAAADRPAGAIYLIPVRLDDCSIPELRQEEYGIQLSDYQWANLFEDDGFDRLVKAIELGFPNTREFVNSEVVTSSSNSLERIKPIRNIPQPSALSVYDLSSVRFGVNYYTELRDLLASGNWKEADRQTSECMLDVLFRQEEGYLNVEDIKKLPYLDLHNIDQLWVAYSQGRFGFSVQKEIYLKCVGILNLQDEEDWEDYEEELHKFEDAVGWRVDGKFRNYDEYTFSLEGKYGHLPSMRTFSFELNSKNYAFSIWNWNALNYLFLLKCL